MIFFATVTHVKFKTNTNLGGMRFLMNAIPLQHLDNPDVVWPVLETTDGGFAATAHTLFTPLSDPAPGDRTLT